MRLREVRLLLLALDSNGGTDPLGMYSLLVKRVADVLAPRFGACGIPAASSFR